MPQQKIKNKQYSNWESILFVKSVEMKISSHSWILVKYQTIFTESET